MEEFDSPGSAGGFGCRFGGSLFGIALDKADLLCESLVSWAHHNVFGWAIPVLYGAGAVGLSVILVRKIAPEAGGGGIS